MDVASSIARKCGTHLIVLYAYRLIVDGTGPEIARVKRMRETDARRRFADIEEKILSAIPGLSYEFNVEVGFTADRITFHIRRNGISMIVMNQSLAQTFNEYGNLQQFIKDKQLPFLLVPTDGDFATTE